MLENVEKAVLRHPLTIVPKPVTFPSTGRRIRYAAG
jgi:hypothetical protein